MISVCSNCRYLSRVCSVFALKLVSMEEEIMYWWVGRVLSSWVRTHRGISRPISSGVKAKVRDEDVEKQAKEYLDNLPVYQKKQLKVIEMEYEILRANNEQVPSSLTCKQKKLMLLNIDSKEEQLKYLYNLKRTEEFRATQTKRKHKNWEHFEVYPFERHGTFVFAETRHFHIPYIVHRMHRATLTGMPIVFDVGYPMNQKENWTFLKNLMHAWKFAKEHTEPAHIIVAGLKYNPVLKESIFSRSEILSMLIDFHDEPYSSLFPSSSIVYIIDNGPELTEVDGNKVYVLFCGNRWPKLSPDADVKSVPYQQRLFSGTMHSVLHLKTKLLMDLSIERDIDKVYVQNFKDGSFKQHQSAQKHKQAFLAEKDKNGNR